jgi:hypothetical protein
MVRRGSSQTSGVEGPHVPMKPNTALAGIRNDIRQAKAVIDSLFATKTARTSALRVLGRAVRVAARVAPASWGISLFPRRLCLNVGRSAVLQFYPEEIVFIVTGRLLKQVHQTSGLRRG